jgi:acyl-CoA synthetase (AMP-forming)/AMP-acid ligase II
MEPDDTVTSVLVAGFSEHPDREALVFLPEGAGSPAVRVSYGLLDRRARATAAWLQRHGTTGRQVMLAMEPGVDLVVAVLGCLYAGAVAVPAPPPGTSRAAAERTVGIAKDAAIRLVLTRAESAGDVSRQLSLGGWADVPCLAVDTLPDTDADEWRMPRLSGADPAFVQYTSGTTAAPRGVRISHANLLAAMESLRSAMGTGPGSRIGGWLPYYHDLGLVGQLLHPLWLGATAVLMPTERYLTRPAEWLEAVSRHRITVAAAPDSAYARCTAEITDEELAGLDLSHWEIAVNASESVHAGTLAAFEHRFAAAGLRPGALTPAYGLAEATLLVTSATAADRPGTPGRPCPVDPRALGLGRIDRVPDLPGAQLLVSSGRPAPGVELAVVDPGTRAELPFDSVGEILVRGPMVSSGYWERPLETAAAFDLRTGSGRHGFFATGDLGALHQGELYVVGRIKDVLKVDGRSLHPQEIERRLIDCGTRLSSAAVFAVGGVREQLVVIQEVRGASRTRDDRPDLVARIRRCLAEEFGASAAAVVLVRPGTVRRTTSGKIRRSVMREQFLLGEIRPLHAEFSAELRLLLPERALLAAVV